MKSVANRAMWFVVKIEGCNETLHPLSLLYYVQEKFFHGLNGEKQQYRQFPNTY